ncbi:MAG: hypothetical protein ACD_2C00209G0008 [uncultured bacterium (gcode 4)]|uniref:Uncharacterized protein n=1 Tax=uncultured bacterium (gcode 4) TaxID=1234023 RepID=K2GFV5_9BACT|nr:MAG: hypothetical protein ACD_2C00209G0008 [uncultured bacterium (gcode 4)]
MKKYILILTSLIILSIPSVNAEGACLLKDWPWEWVKNYITDLATALSEIQKDASSSDCWTSWTWSFDNLTWNTNKAVQEMTADVNQILTPDWFLSSWEFNIAPLFWWKVPDQFYRDHDFIEKQTDKINTTQKAVGAKCALWLAPKSSSLVNIANKYKIDAKSLSSILWWFRKMNNKWIALFRCTVVGSMSSCESSDTENPFYTSITQDYDESALSACVAEDKWMAELWEKIWKIFNWDFWFWQITKWIEDWKKSLRLLSGVTWGWWEAYAQKERELLAKELSRQWLSATQASAVLKNLECMNNNTETISQCIFKSISWWISRLKGAITQAFTDVNKQIWQADDVKYERRYFEQYDTIASEIKSQYDNFKILITIQNKKSDIAIANLIQLHKNLIETNEELKKTIKPAGEACRKQWQDIPCP